MAAAILVQLPYRVVAMAGRNPLPLGMTLPKLFGLSLIMKAIIAVPWFLTGRPPSILAYKVAFYTCTSLFNIGYTIFMTLTVWQSGVPIFWWSTIKYIHPPMPLPGRMMNSVFDRIIKSMCFRKRWPNAEQDIAVYFWWTFPELRASLDLTRATKRGPHMLANGEPSWMMTIAPAVVYMCVPFVVPCLLFWKCIHFLIGRPLSWCLGRRFDADLFSLWIPDQLSSQIRGLNTDAETQAPGNVRPSVRLLVLPFGRPSDRQSVTP